MCRICVAMREQIYCVRAKKYHVTILLFRNNVICIKFRCRCLCVASQKINAVCPKPGTFGRRDATKLRQVLSEVPVPFYSTLLVLPLSGKGEDSFFYLDVRRYVQPLTRAKRDCEGRDDGNGEVTTQFRGRNGREGIKRLSFALALKNLHFYASRNKTTPRGALRLPRREWGCTRDRSTIWFTCSTVFMVAGPEVWELFWDPVLYAN